MDAFAQTGFDEIQVTKAYDQEGTPTGRDGIVCRGRR